MCLNVGLLIMYKKANFQKRKKKKKRGKKKTLEKLRKNT